MVDFRLRLSVDDDPARTLDLDFGRNSVGGIQLLDAPEPLGSWIRTGRSLRLSNLNDPREAYLYPLAGLREVLDLVPGGCS